MGSKGTSLLGLAVSLAVVAACSSSKGPMGSGDGTSDAAGSTTSTGDDASSDCDVPSFDAGPGDATGAGADPDASAIGSGDAMDASDASDAPVDLGLACDDAGTSAPALLGCTGLYANWPSRTIAANAAAFDPGVHLWSDGADKRRFIALPPGTQIDTSNMDEWTFPVGTKIWKEFSLAGQKVETRYLWKRGDGDWLRTTYQWSDDELTATELTTGALDVRGTGYEIPPQEACTTCHMGRIDFVLGFEAVSLSSPSASGLTMSELVKRGWLTNPPATPIVIPGNATEQPALAWLHANCGMACHNNSPRSFAGSTGMWLRLNVGQLATVQSTDTYTTTVNVPSEFQPSGQTGFKRITPHDSAHSCIPFRDGSRDANGEGNQMPPIDTHVVDTNGVALVKAWIDAMPAQ